MSIQIIAADSILAGNDMKELKNSCIVVKEDEIIDILPVVEAKNKFGKDALVLDLGNVTLMPGLIESHNHLALDARKNEHLGMMGDSECRLTSIAIKALRDDLLAGITFARCMGDKYYMDTILAKEIESGELIGPTLFTCGIGMRGIHGHGFVGVPHTGKEEFRKTARTNMLNGCNHLKIFITSGMPPREGSAPYFLSYDEMKTAVDEGTQLGIKVSAHCVGGEGLKLAVKAGVHAFDHLYAASDEEIQLLIDNDCWAVLTSGIFLDESREEFCPANKVANVQHFREEVRERMKSIIKSGVKIALGTDAYHTYLYREAVYANECGMSILEALKGITIRGAELCGVDKSIGSLDVGKKADIIAVDGKPLTDLNCLANVKFVMKHGKIYSNHIA